VLAECKDEGCNICAILHFVIDQEMSTDLHREDIKPNDSGANLTCLDSSSELDVLDVVPSTMKIDKAGKPRGCHVALLAASSKSCANEFLLFCLADMQRHHITNC